MDKTERQSQLRFLTIFSCLSCCMFRLIYFKSQCTENIIRIYSRSNIFLCFFKVCKSVHHHTIQINYQLYATISPVLLSWRLFTAQHVSGVFTPIIRSSTTAGVASGLAVGAWWQCWWSWSGRPVRLRPTALLSPLSEGKTRGCSCSCWAPDDGREDARNMLSCK